MNHYLTEKTKKKNTAHKSDPSNLLVDGTKTIVKLYIFVLKVILPNSKVCVSDKLVLSNSLQVTVEEK